MGYTGVTNSNLVFYNVKITVIRMEKISRKYEKSNITWFFSWGGNSSIYRLNLLERQF